MYVCMSFMALHAYACVFVQYVCVLVHARMHMYVNVCVSECE